MSFLSAWLFVRAPEDERAALTGWLHTRRDVVLRRTARRDLFLDRELEVLEIGVRPPARLPAVLHAAAEAFPHLTYYDADIPLPPRYPRAPGTLPPWGSRPTAAGPSPPAATAAACCSACATCSSATTPT